MTGILRLADLRIDSPDPAGGMVHPVRGISLTLNPGEVTAVVGESGAGKSMMISAVTGLLPVGARVQGSIQLRRERGSEELIGLPDRRMRHLRGREIGVISQQAAFCPVRTVAAQLGEVARAVDATTDQLRELIDLVGLSQLDLHVTGDRLSGGELRRAGVVAGLVGSAPVLLADEATAGVDEAMAEHLVSVIRSRADRGAAVLMITHDLQIAGAADHVAVVYAGEVLERGRARDVLTTPRHEYTRLLLASLPGAGLHPLPGIPPDLTDQPRDGECLFHRRVGRSCSGSTIPDAPGWQVACAEGDP